MHTYALLLLFVAASLIAGPHALEEIDGKKDGLCHANVYSYPSLHWYFPGVPTPAEFSAARNAKSRAGLDERPDRFVLRLYAEALDCPPDSELSTSLATLLDRASPEELACGVPEPPAPLPAWTPAARQDLAELLQALKNTAPASLRAASRAPVAKWVRMRIAGTVTEKPRTYRSPYDNRVMHDTYQALAQTTGKLKDVLNGNADPEQTFTRHVLGFDAEMSLTWNKRTSGGRVDDSILGPEVSCDQSFDGVAAIEKLPEGERVAQLYRWFSDIVRGCVRKGSGFASTYTSDYPFVKSVQKARNYLCQPNGAWDLHAPYVAGVATDFCDWGIPLTAVKSDFRTAVAMQLRAMERAARLGRASVKPTAELRPLLKRFAAEHPDLAKSRFATAHGFTEPAPLRCDQLAAPARPVGPPPAAPAPKEGLAALTDEDFEKTSPNAPLDCARAGLPQEDGSEFTPREIKFLRLLDEGKLGEKAIADWVRESDPAALHGFRCRTKQVFAKAPGDLGYNAFVRARAALEPHEKEIQTRYAAHLARKKDEHARAGEARKAELAKICGTGDKGQGASFFRAQALLAGHADRDGARAAFVAINAPGATPAWQAALGKFAKKKSLTAQDLEGLTADLADWPTVQIDQLAHYLKHDENWNHYRSLGPAAELSDRARAQIVDIVERYAEARRADPLMRETARRVLAGEETLASIPYGQAERLSDYFHFLGSDAQALQRRGCSPHAVATWRNARGRALAASLPLEPLEAELADQLFRMDDSAFDTWVGSLEKGRLPLLLQSVEKIVQSFNRRHPLFGGLDGQVERVPAALAAAFTRHYSAKFDAIRKAIADKAWEKLDALKKDALDNWLIEFWAMSQLAGKKHPLSSGIVKSFAELANKYRNEIGLLSALADRKHPNVILYQQADGSEIIFQPNQYLPKGVPIAEWNKKVEDRTKTFTDALQRYATASAKANNQAYPLLLAAAYGAVIDGKALETQKDRDREEAYGEILAAMADLKTLGLPASFFSDFYKNIADLVKKDSEGIQKQVRSFILNSALVAASGPFISGRLVLFAAGGLGFGLGADIAQQAARKLDASLKGKPVPDFDWNELVAAGWDGTKIGAGLGALSGLPAVQQFAVKGLVLYGTTTLGISGIKHAVAGDYAQATTDVALAALPIYFYPRGAKPPAEPATPTATLPADKAATLVAELRLRVPHELTPFQRQKLAEALVQKDLAEAIRALKTPDPATGVPAFSHADSMTVARALSARLSPVDMTRAAKVFREVLGKEHDAEALAGKVRDALQKAHEIPFETGETAGFNARLRRKMEIATEALENAGVPKAQAREIASGLIRENVLGHDALEVAAARSRAEGVNYRSLTEQDVLSILSGKGVVARGNVTGASAMADVIYSNRKDTIFICTTEVHPAVLKAGDAGLYIRFKVSKLKPGTYKTRAELKAETKTHDASNRSGWVDQQAHTMVLRNIPLEAIEVLEARGVTYRGNEIVELAKRVETCEVYYEGNQAVLLSKKTWERTTMPIDRFLELSGLSKKPPAGTSYVVDPTPPTGQGPHIMFPEPGAAP